MLCRYQIQAALENWHMCTVLKTLWKKRLMPPMATFSSNSNEEFIFRVRAVNIAGITGAEANFTKRVAVGQPDISQPSKI